MVKFRIYGFALMATTFAAKAQDLSQATKAIDAEQYEKAKTLLKQSFSANPANGKSAFLLGNIYLKQEVVDSAKIYFEKGVSSEYLEYIMEKTLESSPNLESSSKMKAKELLNILSLNLNKFYER